MKAAALLRVSTEHQDLESQRHSIETWAAREGAIVRYYEEPAVSGAAKQRPVLDQLLTDARRGRFDVLVVATLDRVAVAEAEVSPPETHPQVRDALAAYSRRRFLDHATQPPLPRDQGRQALQHEPRRPGLGRPGEEGPRS